MRRWWGPRLSTIVFAARAAIWKRTPGAHAQPPSAGLRTLAICAFLAFTGNLVWEYVTAGTQVRFNPYGLNADLACLLVALAVTAAFVRAEWRAAVLSALALLSCFSCLAIAAIAFGLQKAGVDLGGPASWPSKYSGGLILFTSLVWWLGAVTTVFRSLEPERARALPKALAFALALFASVLALPYYPTFRGANFDVHTSSLWQFIPAYLNGSLSRRPAPPPRTVDGAEVDFSQPALLDAQLSAVSPRTPGETNIYAIGIAGSADQNVFKSELKGGLDVLSRVFSLNGRIVQLVNHPDTVKLFPVASRQNLASAVRGLARVMDTDEDILLLFATSHGTKEGIILSLPGAVYAGLAPTDVAALLDRNGIKNRIIIVSACYSGVFLKPLANDHTIIITAADDTSTSFGCGNEQAWTYFGDAFFNRSLRAGVTLDEAFGGAKATIAQWEAREHLTPSNPQGRFGAALMEKLRPLYRSAPPGTGWIERSETHAGYLR
jgi:hypothetical protein